ncbi:MAG: hypothetical protein ABIR98_07960 [Usitatibacter sp.]
MRLGSFDAIVNALEAAGVRYLVAVSRCASSGFQPDPDEGARRPAARPDDIEFLRKIADGAK